MVLKHFLRKKEDYNIRSKTKLLLYLVRKILFLELNFYLNLQRIGIKVEFE